MQPVSAEANTISLNTPASRCLLLLLQKKGEVVTQTDFFQQVWENKGLYANTNTLYQNISLIRKALRKAGVQEDVIHTLPREGFSFLGTVILLEDDCNVADDNTTLFLTDSTLATDSVDSIDNSVSIESKLTTTANDSFFSRISVSVSKYLQSIYGNKKTLLLIAISLTLYVLLFIYIHRLFKDEQYYFSNYINIGVVNQCTIFRKGTDSLRRNDDYLDFFKKKNIHCEPRQNAFIAMNAQGVKVFVHFCENERDTLSCYSNFYIE